MWLQVSLGKRKLAEQETSFCLKQLLAIWPISFQAFPHTVLVLTSHSASCFFTLLHKHFSITWETIYLSSVWDSPMVTCTAACYSDLRSLCTAEGSKWGWKRKAHNKMLMKTPSPQIVSVHSLVRVEAFFPSCWSIIKMVASDTEDQAQALEGQANGEGNGKEGQVPSPGEKAKEREQKMYLGFFETPRPRGIMAPSLDTLPLIHPLAHSVHSQPNLITCSSQNALPPFSTHWALSLPSKGLVHYSLSYDVIRQGLQ